MASQAGSGSMSDLRKAIDIKRKADESPETEKPFPRLRRRASLPDLQDATDPKKSYSLSELMKRGFLDPEVTKEIVPTIASVLKPSIELTIKNSIDSILAASIKSSLDAAMTQFRNETLQPLLNQKDQEIKELKSKLDIQDKKLKELESNSQKSSDTITYLTDGLNNLEQYGRRNNLRLNNVHLDNDSDSQRVVMDIINRALSEEESITASDIDRCHPIGKPNRKGNRQVIIKFASYKAKEKVYSARFNLSNVYITEDFTPTYQKVVNKLVMMKKAKRVRKFWTIDGKIFAKATETRPKYRIKSIKDISDMMAQAVDEGYMLERLDEMETEVQSQSIIA